MCSVSGVVFMVRHEKIVKDGSAGGRISCPFLPFILEQQWTLGGRLPIFRRGGVVITQFRCIPDENISLPNIEQVRKQYDADIAFFPLVF